MRRVVLSAVCLRGIAGSKTAGGVDVSLSCDYCFRSQVEVSATNRLLVQRIYTECGVLVCDLDTSTMRRLGPTRDCRDLKIKIVT